MSEMCKLELTPFEESITKPGSTETLPYLLRAAGKKGFYESKTGWLCYPVIVRNRKEFICIRKDKYYLWNEDISFDPAGKLEFFTLEINNGLLPKVAPDENGPTAEFLEAEKNKNTVTLKTGNGTYIYSAYATSFGGGYSDGSHEGIAKILYGEGINITELPQEDRAKIENVVEGQLIDNDGYILGTNNIVVETQWIRNPDHKGHHLKIVYKSIYNSKKIGLYKKNEFYDKLKDNVLICHKIFETKTGLPIYDIDRVLK